MDDITFVASCDGTQQKYVCVLPAEFDAARPHDVLIALHGHGSDRWQFVNDPRDECRAARDVAAAHRMIYVSPDYRAKTSWMGPEAESDVLDIIAHVKEAHAVSRVFLCGGSMGGTSALTFTVLHPDLIDGVAAINGHANHVKYTNFQDAIAESFGGGKQDVPEEYAKRSAELHADALTMPVGLTTGGEDTSVPPDSVLRLAEDLSQTNPDVLLIHRPETGHTSSYEDVCAVLEFVIERAGEKGTE